MPHGARVMADHWYVARTKPRVEHRVAKGLKAWGFDVFCPYVPVFYAGGRRGQAPLFPSYVLLNADLDAAALRRFRDVPGFLGLVRFGDFVPEVPEPVVAQWRQRLEEVQDDGAKSPRWFKPGDWVQVRVGHADRIAQVIGETKPGMRVALLLDLLGRQIEVEAPISSLGFTRSVIPADGSEVTKRSRRTRGGGRWVRGFGPRAEPSAA